MIAGRQMEGESVHVGVLLLENDWFYDGLKQEWLCGFCDAKQAVEPLGVAVELIDCETDLPNEFAEKIETSREGA